ncbi:helix-turn-helix domain-containing protein [Komagataeibacter rhaeticus]|nr:helix-turn-helix domain-containing protein [Komagataeibacter rhaeticus]
MRWPAAWSTILLLPRRITMTEADSEISLTFARGLALLRAFDADGKGMTVADLARRLDYTRAATRRLVRTLEMAGYVTADGTRYMLTPLVLKLGLGFLQSRSIGRLVGPVLHGNPLRWVNRSRLRCCPGGNWSMSSMPRLPPRSRRRAIPLAAACR